MNGQVENQRTSKSVQNAKVRIGTRKRKLTQERLKEVLDYNQNTGIFTWKKRISHCVRVGSVAGCKSSDGYILITIDKKQYKAHRLAHLFVDGFFPEHDIDHINGNRIDNRWDNIRPVSVMCNNQNKKMDSRNKSGFPGVSRRKTESLWRAVITINGKSRHLGRYEDKLDAALARYTFEVQCEKWNCNHRSEIVKAIKKEWPEFNAVI